MGRVPRSPAAPTGIAGEEPGRLEGWGWGDGSPLALRFPHRGAFRLSPPARPIGDPRGCRAGSRVPPATRRDDPPHRVTGLVVGDGRLHFAGGHFSFSVSSPRRPRARRRHPFLRHPADQAAQSLTPFPEQPPPTKSREASQKGRGHDRRQPAAPFDDGRRRSAGRPCSRNGVTTAPLRTTTDGEPPGPVALPTSRGDHLRSLSNLGRRSRARRRRKPLLKERGRRGATLPPRLSGEDPGRCAAPRPRSSRRTARRGPAPCGTGATAPSHATRRQGG